MRELIDRAALIAEYDRVHVGPPGGARKLMEDAPTIEEHKTGKWIEYDSDEDKYDIIQCPCCKNTFTVDSFHWTDIGFIKDDFKFCPNCGADMRQREE